MSLNLKGASFARVTRGGWELFLNKSHIYNIYVICWYHCHCHSYVAFIFLYISFETELICLVACFTICYGMMLLLCLSLFYTQFIFSIVYHYEEIIYTKIALTLLLRNVKLVSLKRNYFLHKI